MEDITGLGKLAESQLANKVYDDLLAQPMKEGGQTLVDLIKAFRLFTAPIQLFAVAQDRLANFCARVREAVPEDRQIEASPSIAAPILLDLRYMEDDNPLTALYLNLLKRAIDRDRVHEAHPAFAKIIGLLAPDEALILHKLNGQEFELIQTLDYDKRLNRFMNPVTVSQEFPVSELNFPENFNVYTSHLASLDLVVFPVTHQEPVWDDTVEPGHQKGELQKASLMLTKFGKMFVSACEP